MTDSNPQAASRAKRSIFLPFAMIAVALLGSLGSDIYQESRRYSVLTDRNAQLDALMRDSRNVRNQFNVLVEGLAQLKGAGNRHAADLLARLEHADVTSK